MSEVDASSTQRISRAARPLGWAFTLLAISALAWLNWKWPVVRFRDYRADEIGLFALLLLPVPAGILLAVVLRGWKRALALVLLLPVVLLNCCTAFLIGLAAVDDLRKPVDGSFEPVGIAEVAGSEVVLYRTNCGATCAYGLEARHERVLIPGVLMLVRRLALWYPGEGGTVVRSGRGSVRIATDGVRRDGPSGAREFALRPWVYF